MISEREVRETMERAAKFTVYGADFDRTISERFSSISLMQNRGFPHSHVAIQTITKQLKSDLFNKGSLAK